MEQMVQSRPPEKKLWKMEDGSRIEAETFKEALKIYNSLNEKI
jgi:hypothetical protein